MPDRLPVLLTEELWFPNPQTPSARGAPKGLVAFGGDLSVERLLLAYRMGIFPWSIDPLTWWSPLSRGIFELDGFHVPRSLERTLRRNVFEITIDRAFRDVMIGCSERKDEPTWITPHFVDAYSTLHQQGHAHSVECWHEGKLVGGIYGVHVGGLFAGESMFFRMPDASKVALYHLVMHLKQRGFALFDIQMVTPITERLGAVSISRADYLKRLAEAVKENCPF